MPIYEYVCTACAHRAELLHGIHDSGPNFCPACGAEGTMRKGITAPAVVFKGTGWAKLDRRTASRSRNQDAKDGGTEAAASDGKSPDAKPSESKAPEATTSDAKAPDARTSDRKGADSKPAEPSKPASRTESKPASRASEGD